MDWGTLTIGAVSGFALSRIGISVFHRHRTTAEARNFLSLGGAAVGAGLALGFGPGKQAKR